MTNQAFNYITNKMANKYQYGHSAGNTARIYKKQQLTIGKLTKLLATTTAIQAIT